jgi:adenine-specific DNA-methyltransferase
MPPKTRSRVDESYLQPARMARAIPGLSPRADLGYGYNHSGNMIVQGDNLDVLRQLLPLLRGSVRCIYIDPPYNNNEVYTHYNDRWSEGQWANDLRVRMRLLHQLLTEDGSLWVSIDDSEVHHVRCIGEEIFGRQNFVHTIVWNHRTTRENRKLFSNNHEYILCFAKRFDAFKRSRNPLPSTEEVLARYKNPDHDPRGPWQSVSLNVQAGHATAAQFYTITGPTGRRFDPPKGRCWAFNEIRMRREIDARNVYFGKTGEATPRLKKFLCDAKTGITPETLWTAKDVGTTDRAKKDLMALLHTEAVFDTPKPEGLIHRVLTISTQPGDLVLDAYLGSGTTAATALKMGRCFIGIERGDHIVSHAVERLRRVIDGETSGVSDIESWDGGDGFEFFDLVPENA